MERAVKQRTPVRRRRLGKPRRGPLRCKKYREFLSSQICCLYGPGRGVENFECVRLVTDPAHTINNGTSSKGPDSSCVPLCRTHHLEYDSGREAFEKKYSVDMKAIAAQYYARYLEEQAA